jgi:peptide/nickel transport system substrate-binding protein
MQRVFYIAGLLLLFFSCTRNQQDNSHLVFRYNESKGITTLDPAFARSLPLIWPVHQLYNGLVQLSDSLTIVPCIANSWEISDDGLVYTFHLRTDVLFHNSPAFPEGKGRSVVASDFIYSFGRVIDPLVASPGAWIFSVLDTQRPNTINGCRADNDSTLIIHLNKPFPAFLGLLSMPYAYVVPQEAVELYGKDFRSNPVGTGPFRFQMWREGEKLILRKNPNYFEVDDEGIQLPYLEAISITFIADKQSEFLEFLKGNADFLSGVHAASKDELLTRSGKLNPHYKDRVKMITGPYLNTEYLGFLVDTTLESVRNSPLNDVKVRKAIALGFDRSRMMTYLRSNMGYPAHNGFVPSGMPGFSSELQGFSFNPDLSRKLLAEAGFPEGKGLPVITISTTSDYVDIFEFIQHQLSEVGIGVNIEVFPGAAYRDMMANSRLTLFRGSWVADYADAENYLSLFHTDNFSPAGPNYTHFSNTEFDRLYKEALTQPIDSLRFKIYRQMDSLVIAHVPVIPLYYDKVVRFTGNDIVGLGSNPMNLLVIKRVKKIERP